MESNTMADMSVTKEKTDTAVDIPNTLHHGHVININERGLTIHLK